jgi:tRNA (cytidine/uridine-2'-O-)-methyltransferase
VKDLRLAVYEPDIAPNLGTMIRTCACFGVPLDLIEPCGFPMSVKTLRRAAMDYADFAEVSRHDSWELFLKNARPPRLVLLTTKATAGLWEFSFQPGDTLMVGRESAGVPDAVHQACDEHLRIPMPAGGRSLNVAVAASIALGEALRQSQAHAHD